MKKPETFYTTDAWHEYADRCMIDLSTEDGNMMLKATNKLLKAHEAWLNRPMLPCQKEHGEEKLCMNCMEIRHIDATEITVGQIDMKGFIYKFKTPQSEKHE